MCWVLENRVFGYPKSKLLKFRPKTHEMNQFHGIFFGYILFSESKNYFLWKIFKEKFREID